MSLHLVAVILTIATGLVAAGIVGGLVAVPLLAVANTAIRYLSRHPTCACPTASRTARKPTDDSKSAAGQREIGVSAAPGRFEEPRPRSCSTHSIPPPRPARLAPRQITGGVLDLGKLIMNTNEGLRGL